MQGSLLENHAIIIDKGIIIAILLENVAKVTYSAKKPIT